MTEIDKGAGIAVWRQIEDLLKGEITDGTFEPGDKLPTEFALAERFGVNRHTVRRAVASLVERGLVRVDQGRGTFVHEDIVDYAVRKRTRFSENVAGQNRMPGGVLLAADVLPAAGTMARKLGLGKNDRVILLRLLRLVDDRPISVTDHYFDAARFPDMRAVYEREGSITAALAHYGIPDYSRQQTKVTARMPSREEAELLRQPPTRPVLATENVNVSPDGRVVEYGVARMAGDRVQLVFEP